MTHNPLSLPRRSFLQALAAVGCSAVLADEKKCPSRKGFAVERRLVPPSIKPGMRFLDLAWARDGSLLALKQRGPDQILLIDCENGRVIRTVKHTGLAFRFCFQGATRDLLLFAPRGSVLKYDWSNDSLDELFSFGDRTRSACVSPDGRFILAAVSYEQPTIQLAETNIARKIYELETGHRKGSAVVAFSPNGESFAVGTSSGALTIHETKSGSLTKELRGHQSPLDSRYSIHGLTFSPDGKTLVTIESKLAGVTWWDVANGTHVITELDAHVAHLSIAYSPNGTEVATGLANGVISIRSAGTRNELMKIDPHESEVFRLEYSPDSCLLGSISQGQKVSFTERP